MLDQQFREAVTRAALDHVRDLLPSAAGQGGRPHRELMREAKVLLSVIAADVPVERGPLLAAVRSRLDALRSLQAATGLFAGGDNLQSPPDSAFTINDACDAYALLGPLAGDPEIHEVRSRIAAIIHAATEPLLHGGVHTPNHRWEISAALARIHRSFPDARLVARAQEWLAEGVDVDADGFYSERSPNYAAYVSNPSLTVLADILNCSELWEIVLRNLETTLGLLRPDGTVETVQSRRQDQNAPFPLAPYLSAFRAAAVATGRGDFADAARRAALPGVHDPELLAQTLLRPQLLEQLPEPIAPAQAASTYFPAVALASRVSPIAETVLYGGSDYAVRGRIRSGLANNPTFCRVFAGDAVLDSVRLSRAFFDLGPFRASTLRRLGDDVYLLEETIDAAYYQPLGPSDRRADGLYDLVDDGRFSASMSFQNRHRDVVRMTTAIEAALVPDGVDLRVRIDSPELPWSLEFGFREGGAVVGGVREPDGTWILPAGEGEYRVGGSRIAVRLDGAALSQSPLPYGPGQDCGFLGATDAVDGVRVRLGGTAPTEFVVHIRAEREDVR